MKVLRKIIILVYIDRGIMSKKKYIDDMTATEFVAEVNTFRHDPSKFLKYCQILTSEGFSTFKPYAWQKKQLQNTRIWNCPLLL